MNPVLYVDELVWAVKEKQAPRVAQPLVHSEVSFIGLSEALARLGHVSYHVLVEIGLLSTPHTLLSAHQKFELLH